MVSPPSFPSVFSGIGICLKKPYHYDYRKDYYE